MDLDPYIPRDVIDAGRYRPTGRIRVVDYPDPYPDRSAKMVTIEVRDERGELVTGTALLQRTPLEGLQGGHRTA